MRLNAAVQFVVFLLSLPVFSPSQIQDSGPENADPCDLLIVGGSFGGCAAAHTARGAKIVLVEESEWLGGQVSSQGVAALDEHALIETTGVSRSYLAFRSEVRRRSAGRRNPGGGWVSRLCFLPRTGRDVLESMVIGPKTLVFMTSRVVEVRRTERRVTAVRIVNGLGVSRWFAPQIVLDASDLGDFYPLADIPFTQGIDARAETGEPHAPLQAEPAALQSYTVPFAVEYRPGESHVIPRPADYDSLRDLQPFRMAHGLHNGIARTYAMFEKAPGSFGPFFTYRRIAPDVAMINWLANDDRGPSLLAGLGTRGRQLSAAFLYWMQTEMPRDDGGTGYPELKPRSDLMGAPDGQSLRPYVREGRRLLALDRVSELDLTGVGPRGRRRDDSVGVGWYPIDRHGLSGDPDDARGLVVSTLPFQIPLGSLIPQGVDNVLAAGKSLGVTHLANAAFRVHPIEWSVGEAAAMTALYVLHSGTVPAEIRADPGHRRRLHAHLLGRGVPLVWFSDLPIDHRRFQEVQAAALDHPELFDWKTLKCNPDDLILGPTRE